VASGSLALDIPSKLLLQRSRLLEETSFLSLNPGQDHLVPSFLFLTQFNFSLGHSAISL
jgi:hypothetical protein